MIVRLTIPTLYDNSHLPPSFPEVKTDENDTNTGKKRRYKNLKKFEINQVSSEDLKKMGFSNKLANTFINYRNTIGGFQHKNQMKKIYGLSENDFYLLKKFGYLKSSPAISKKLNINTCNYYQLNNLLNNQKISNRILKFRESLGGFYDQSQFNEIYEITDHQRQLLEKNTNIDLTKIRSINLRYTTLKTLERHPYIDKKQAKKIYLLVKKNASFNFRDSAYLDHFDSSFVTKVVPYLSNIDTSRL